MLSHSQLSQNPQLGDRRPSKICVVVVEWPDHHFDVELVDFLSPGGAGRGGYQWGIGGQSLAGVLLDEVQLPHHSQDPRQLAG